MTESTLEYRPPEWADVQAAGGEDAWIRAELTRRGLRDEQTDTSSFNEAQKKRYRARREEERRVARLLKKDVWAAYKGAHLVHIGHGLWHHDTADIDRYDLDDPEKRRIANELPELKDVHGLAKALELSVARIRWLIYQRDVDRGTHYKRWTIPKRDGSPRLISSPKPDLKAAQHWILHNVCERLPIHGAAHGFVAGRSIVTNAVPHAGAQVVVKLDLKDFYPTITAPRVKGLFRKAGYGEQVATVMALLCTESPREAIDIEGVTYYVATGPRSLPQGAPTSPAITNTLCLKLDSRLSGLAAHKGLSYTRYADDLTFSWSGPGDAQVSHLIGSVRKIVESEGFIVHPKKTRVMRKGGRQKVTGLVVNSATGGALARVPRKTVRNLRAAIRNRELGRPHGDENLQQLQGMAAFIHMTDPERGASLLARIAALKGAQNE